MKVAIIGASGSIGSALTRYILDNTNFTVVLFSHHAERLHYAPDEEPRITHIDGDILRLNDITTALDGCNTVVYLVHLMGNQNVGRDFERAEVTAAQNLVTAVKNHKIQRVVYVGGAGSEEEAPTRHLKSRQTTGEIIRSGVPQLIEYRTPMVIGPNAAGYEVIRAIVDKAPFIPVPSWGNADTQPICITDVSKYILAAINTKITRHETIEIGGPEVMSYSQIFKRYAKFTGKKRLIVVTPFIPKRLVAGIFRMFKHNAAIITAADMLESSQHSYKVSRSIPEFAQSIKPESIEKAFEL